MLQLLTPTVTKEDRAMYLVTEFYERYIVPHRENNPIERFDDKELDIKNQITTIIGWIHEHYLEDYKEYIKVIGEVLGIDHMDSEGNAAIYRFFKGVIKEHCLNG